MRSSWIRRDGGEGPPVPPWEASQAGEPPPPWWREPLLLGVRFAAGGTAVLAVGTLVPFLFVADRPDAAGPDPMASVFGGLAAAPLVACVGAGIFAAVASLLPGRRRAPGRRIRPGAAAGAGLAFGAAILLRPRLLTLLVAPVALAALAALLPARTPRVEQASQEEFEDAAARF